MSIAKKTALFLSVVVMIFGLATWFMQLKSGLVLTNMRNSFTWGLYVSGLAFFVGNAAGGLVLSSLIYLFGVKALKPFAHLGALCAFANVTAAMLVILPDLGQPLKIYNMLLHPKFSSPLVWDVIILNLYALLTLVYFYILYFPNLKGPYARFAIKVEDPQKFSDLWAKRLAPFSLMAALGIHVVTAWIFATQGGREYWHSAVLAPDFIAAAIASGTAVVFIVALLELGITDELKKGYRVMSVIILISFLTHLFFIYNDFFIHLWYGKTKALETLDITFKKHLMAHGFEVFAPLLGIFLLFNRSFQKSVSGMISGAVLVVSGIFVHRLLLMPGAFEKVSMVLHPLGMKNTDWHYPVASGEYGTGLDTFVTEWNYIPSMTEIVIFLGVIGYVSFLILLVLDRLNKMQKVEI